MPCEVTYETLAAFAAGDLDAAEARRVEEHLSACSDCARRLAALRRTDALLRAIPRIQPSTHALLAARRVLADEIRAGREPEIMTLDEVAAYLRLAPEEMDVIAEELPTFELAGQVRIRRSRLEQWIAQRERRRRVQSVARQAGHATRLILWKGVA